MSLVKALGFNPVANINPQTGTTFTPALSDAGQICTLSNASSIAMTVPANSTVAYPIGTFLIVIQGGAGQVTVAAGVGVTLNSIYGSGSQTIAAQNGLVVLRKTGTNTWVVSGDITPPTNVLARSMATSITNTSSKTAAFSFSLAGNRLGTNKVVHVVMTGKWLNNGGGTSTLTMEVNYGGTAMWVAASTLQTASTQKKAWRLEFWLSAQNSSSVQALGGQFHCSNIVAPTTGFGDLTTSLPTNATVINGPFAGDATVDSTSAQTLAVNVTLSRANGSNTFTTDTAIAFMEGEGQKGDTGAIGPTGIGSLSVPDNPLGARTSTSDTPLSTDYGVETPLTSASAITCTIPSSSYLTAGQIAFYRQGGAGAITFAGAGVTIDGNLTTRAQYSVCAVRCISTTHYVVVGDMA